MLTILGSLGGCGMARFAYNNGESLSMFWLDRYVDFTEEQKDWVRPEINSLFSWHRRSELPAYVNLLQRVQAASAGEVREEQVRAELQEVRARLLRVSEQAVPSFARLALSLSPSQIEHLQRKFAANNDDYRKDYLRGDLERRQHARFKRLLGQVEYFFGRLSGEQERWLREWSDARPLDAESSLADRTRRQREMLAMLKRIQAEKPTQAHAEQMLRDYLRQAQLHFGDARMQALYQADEDAAVTLVLKLMNQADAQQRTHLQRTLQNWVRDFQRLHAEARNGIASGPS